MLNRLAELGFSENILQEAAQYVGLHLGRVISQSRDLYKVATENTEVVAEISGKFRYSSVKLSDYPAVGDFVMLDRENPQAGNAIIHNVLTRKSVFIRKAAGTSHDVQVVAANIDFIFICMSLNNDFNLRRLERYLSIAWDSGATPVVVLTKCDLCKDISARLSEITQIAVGVDIVVTSSMSKDGYREILKYIKSGQTVAFLGSSGVGKSTLINRLMGDEIISTGEIRNDDKGRHITTKRELLIIPSGGAVIDTPGMREIGVENVDLAKSFPDIEELASGCRFKDCRHENEPGCAVIRAVDVGDVSRERFYNYKKLKKEAGYEGLNSRQIEKEKISSMYASFGGMKNALEYVKMKNKNR